jgi:hypothetical protein
MSHQRFLKRKTRNESQKRQNKNKKQVKQEVLGRTNRLLFLIRQGPH